jgi:hypothetical protein
MGGFFSSPESNSSIEVESIMGASGSKPSAVAPRLNKLNANIESGRGTYTPSGSAIAPRLNTGNRNIETGLNTRASTNASNPGSVGNRNNRNKTRNARSNVVMNVNRLHNVVVEEPPQSNAGEGLVGNNQAGGRRRHRKGSRKASRKQGHKSRRR